MDVNAFHAACATGGALWSFLSFGWDSDMNRHDAIGRMNMFMQIYIFIDTTKKTEPRKLLHPLTMSITSYVCTYTFVLDTSYIFVYYMHFVIACIFAYWNFP